MVNATQIEDYLTNLIKVLFKSFVIVCVAIVVIVLISVLSGSSDSILVAIFDLSIVIYVTAIIGAALGAAIIYKEDLFKKWWGL